MSGFKSDFMRIVHERGMVHPYVGYDCTARRFMSATCCRS
jgi:hypothetical protein